MSQTSYNTRKRRRGRADQSSYDGLVGTPASLGLVLVGGTSSSLTLPARGRFSVSCTAAMAAGDVAVNIGDNTYPVGATAAGVKRRLSAFGEKSEALSVTRSLAVLIGTFTVYLLDDVGHHKAIATVTFA